MIIKYNYQDIHKDDPDYLAPCPFCGSESEWKVEKHTPSGYDYTPRCKVTSCPGRLSKKYTNKAIAQEKWNTRVFHNLPTKFI